MCERFGADAFLSMCKLRFTLLSPIWGPTYWKISPEILTFEQCDRDRDHEILLACGTGVVRFEYIFLNYSAITQ